MKNKKIRPAFFLHCSDLNNGAVRSLVDIITTLQTQYNIECCVIYPDRPGSAIEYLKKYGVLCKHFRYGPWLYHFDLSGIQLLIEISKIIIKKIISLTTYPSLLYFVKKNKITHLYTNTLAINIGICLNRFCHINHIWHIREFCEEDHHLKCLYGRKHFQRLLNKTDVAICISKALYTKYNEIINQNVELGVIYNDISNYFINPKKDFNSNQILEIAVIGTIQPGKGQLEAIKAVECLREKHIIVNLHIAGSKHGNYYNSLVRYVQDRQLDNIYFDGFITDVNSYRAQMDVALVCSESEAFGRVTVEGMLSMLTVVGADAAGTRELIADRQNGFLYEKGNIDSLVNILALINNHRNLLLEVGKRGYEYAITNFCSGRAAAAVANALSKEN